MYFETLAFVVFLAHVSTAVSMALTVVTATVTSVPAGNVTSLNEHRHWHLEAWSNWGTEGHANETKQRQGKLEKYKKAETKEMSCRQDR